MKCAHLFNGIGGFALAAHWMGWENYMHCEIDPFCNRVMNKHFPNSIQHEDIRKTDFTSYRGTIDLLTGGWPCQPVSTAGKRLGKSDVRYLWPHNIRAIREIQPGWVVGENVRGLTNWEGGILFDEVQADLETEGYEVLPFLLPAAGVNAPHRRDRIWFIAYSANAGLENLRRRREDEIFESGIIADASMFRCEGEFLTWQALQRQKQTCGEAGPGHHKEGDATNSQGVGERESTNETYTIPEGGQTWPKLGSLGGGGLITHTAGIGGVQSECQPTTGQFNKTDWQQFPTQAPVRNGNDGIPDRLAGITVPRWRREGIKALGNSIVPQVALQIFKAIEQYNAL
jgi:DNA (cytosine-5)-methyltransferase 1